ncbi:MAG TPA: ABC transporter ATP-binding protein [Cyclobacteriaceae bacterium]|nr:ABC transporter ATP-binding protein [Cyclobacteriaceae bacterium]
MFSITVENLSKRFNREWIFRNFSFHFESGKTYAVTGPNGSGKSTLLQILWGQMPPTAGTISYSNDQQQLEIDSVFRHLTIATPYMDLIDEFTLTEQLRFHFKMKRTRADSSLEEIMQAMYLHDARDKQISNFSSGMKQRLKLALAFFTESRAVFLDEPGTNLDSKAFEWYLQHLKGLPKDCLVVIASNQSSEYPQDAIKIDIMTYKGDRQPD